MQPAFIPVCFGKTLFITWYNNIAGTNKYLAVFSFNLAQNEYCLHLVLKNRASFLITSLQWRARSMLKIINSYTILLEAAGACSLFLFLLPRQIKKPVMGRLAATRLAQNIKILPGNPSTAPT
jgi:hypothetical protein